MRGSFALLFALALAQAFPAAQTRTAKTLDIYVVDVEGGNATLFVSPSGESLLVDSGNSGAGGGGAAPPGRPPPRHFIDHGPNVQPAAAADDFLRTTYPQLYAKGTHTVAKP